MALGRASHRLPPVRRGMRACVVCLKPCPEDEQARPEDEQAHASAKNAHAHAPIQMEPTVLAHVAVVALHISSCRAVAGGVVSLSCNRTEQCMREQLHVVLPGREEQGLGWQGRE